MMVKSYNSFLLDRLWIGADLKTNPSDTDGRMQMQKYFFDHGLERTSFEQMLRGVNPSRPFIPLQGQMYKGSIKGLKPENEGPATTAIIEADVGELLFLEVPRENIFVYGHWMGKADLSYIFEKGKGKTCENIMFCLFLIKNIIVILNISDTNHTFTFIR